jgi:hypothetical protein
MLLTITALTVLFRQRLYVTTTDTTIHYVLKAVKRAQLRRGRREEEAGNHGQFEALPG